MFIHVCTKIQSEQLNTCQDLKVPQSRTDCSSTSIRSTANWFLGLAIAGSLAASWMAVGLDKLAKSLSLRRCPPHWSGIMFDAKTRKRLSLHGKNAASVCKSRFEKGRHSEPRDEWKGNSRLCHRRCVLIYYFVVMLFKLRAAHFILEIWRLEKGIFRNLGTRK